MAPGIADVMGVVGSLGAEQILIVKCRPQKGDILCLQLQCRVGNPVMRPIVRAVWIGGIAAVAPSMNASGGAKADGEKENSANSQLEAIHRHHGAIYHRTISRYLTKNQKCR
jgi:hypothetical protein